MLKDLAIERSSGSRDWNDSAQLSFCWTSRGRMQSTNVGPGKPGQWTATIVRGNLCPNVIVRG